VDSKLLAFRVAKPVTLDTPGEYCYDPGSQTTVWVGNGRAAASLFCTKVGIGINARQNCNAYGNYCNTWGAVRAGGWLCDAA
jgi:hypothetical protein